MKLVVYFILLFISSQSFSQATQGSDYLKYSYDAAGNRIQRAKITFQSPLRVMNNDTTTKDDKAIRIALNQGINIYPNPVTDLVNIKISSLKDNDKGIISLIDASGKTIFKKDVNNEETQTDFSSIKPGVYHLKVTTGKETLYYRMIKH